MTNSAEAPIDVRERLLKAAWSLLTRPGPDERVTVTRLCGAAGCSPRTLYQHFDSLDQLLAETSRRAFTKWAADIEAAIGHNEDPRERLCRRGHAFIDWGLQHPHAYRALFVNLPSYQSNDGPGFRELLQDIAAVHGLQSDDKRVTVLGLAHMAGVHGLTCLAITQPHMPTDIRTAAYELLCANLDPGRSPAAEPAERDHRPDS